MKLKGYWRIIQERLECKHGSYNYLFMNLIILGCMLFITLAVVGYFIAKLDGAALYVAVVIFMIMIFAEIAWVEIEHNVMKKRMIKGK